MNTIQIRQSKKTLVPFIAILIIAIITMTYFVFFTDKGNGNMTVKIAYIPLTMFIIYKLYGPIKNMMNNKSIITMTDNSITLNTDKITVILKSEIQDIKVDYLDEDGYYLKIKTNKEAIATSISWLDKSPEQIKEMIEKYK